jgi:hypothetical protein
MLPIPDRVSFVAETDADGPFLSGERWGPRGEGVET